MVLDYIKVMPCVLRRAFLLPDSTWFVFGVKGDRLENIYPTTGGRKMAQPEITFRHGACSASVFENEYEKEGQKFTTRTVAFQRNYQDKDGNWQTTRTLKVNDIPKAVLVLEKAYEFLTSTAYSDTLHDEDPL